MCGMERTFSNVKFPTVALDESVRNTVAFVVDAPESTLKRQTHTLAVRSGVGMGDGHGSIPLPPSMQHPSGSTHSWVLYQKVAALSSRTMVDGFQIPTR